MNRILLASLINSTQWFPLIPIYFMENSKYVFFDSHEQAAFVPRMGTDYTYFSGMNLNRRFCMMAKRRQTWIRGWREKNAEGIPWKDGWAKD